MHSLYQTELKTINSTQRIKKLFPNSTTNKKTKTQLNNLLSRNDLNKKIKERSLVRTLLSDDYLKYIIKEKLNYADIDKITEHYSKKIFVYQKRYDENKILINKKKEELNNLNMELYKNLMNHMNFENTENAEEKLYDEEIEKTKKEIKTKELQIEIFKDMYNKIYKLNLDLSNKVFIETNYSKVYEEQYQRYNDIYNNSINKIQKQEEKLNVLNEYFNKYRNVNNSLVSEKVDKINKLEYEIIMIKNDVVNFEDSYAKIILKNEKFKKIYESFKHGYEIRKNDFNSIKKNYIKEKLKMLEIYDIFSVDNIDNILKEFMLIKQKYNDLTFRFNKSSNELMNLRTELTNKEKKLEEIKQKTIEKKAKVKIESQKSNNELMEIINRQKNGFNALSIELQNLSMNKIDLINFSLNYLSQLNLKIINSLNNSINISPLLMKRMEGPKRKFTFEKYNIKKIEKLTEQKLVIIIINLIKTTITKIYDIVENLLYNMYILSLQKEEEQSQNEEEKEIEKEKDNKVSIKLNNSEEIKNIMASQLKITKEKLRLKKQIYIRNKKELLLSKNEKNEKNEKNSNRSPLNKLMKHSFSGDNIFNKPEKEKKIITRKINFISYNELFNEYINYNKNNNLLERSDFTGINKKFIVEEFSNDMVAEEDLEQKKNEKMKRIKEATKLIKNRLEEKELNNFLKKNSNKKKILELKNNIKATKSEDQEEEEEMKDYEKELNAIKEELKESKSRKKFKIKLANPENELITNRYEDIRMLEFNYIKNYSDYRVEQSIFNEYFYNVRKKFIGINKKQKYSHELNVSYSNRNIIKANKMKKNFSLVLPKIEKKS